mgnify:CR=1 FL=1
MTDEAASGTARTGVRDRFWFQALAVVVVDACGQRQMRYQNGGASYFSQSIVPVYFGLGTCKTADTVEIRWPSGKRQTLRDVSTDQHMQVEESQ